MGKEQALEDRINYLKSKLDRLSKNKAVRDYLLLLDKLSVLEKRYDSLSGCSHLLVPIDSNVFYCPKCGLVTNRNNHLNSTLVTSSITTIENADYLYGFFKNLGLDSNEIGIMMHNNLDKQKQFIKKRDDNN